MNLGGQHYLVSASDHDLYEVVVVAADCDEAVRKAETIYLTSNAGCIDDFAPSGDMQWQAMPVLREACQ